MPVLKTEKLNKIYGNGEAQVNALSCVDFEVEAGEFVSIVGTSGSGKTTLLHMLGGLDRPSSGKVFVGGKDIFTLKEDELTVFRRRKIGFVFQSYNLVPVLNIYENIILPVELDGETADKDYIMQLVNMLGLGSKLESLPSQLSGGQQQRAAIARALVYRPAILLADEPTGNLDRKNSVEIIDLLKLSSHDMNQTILLITHDEKVALEADRILTIEDGKIISDQRR